MRNGCLQGYLRYDALSCRQAGGDQRRAAKTVLFPGTVFGAVLYGYDGDARAAPGIIIRGKALYPAFLLEMGPYGLLEPPGSQSVDDLNRFKPPYEGMIDCPVNDGQRLGNGHANDIDGRRNIIIR